MKNLIIKFLLMIGLVLGLFPTYAQKIVGYYPSYRDPMVGQIEFNKLTDVIFAFMNFNATTGALDLTNEPQLNNLITNARAKNPNIRIHIATGGGGFGTAAFNTMVPNGTARANFINSMVNYIQSKNLDGWNLDWEFPTTTGEKNNHQLLLQDMRTAINAKQAVMCKKLDISIAIGAEMPYNTTLLNLAAVSFVDYVDIMAYDSPTYANHSPLVLAQNGLDGWNTWGIPYSKMILAVPFYGWDAARATALTYSQIAAPDPVTVFNSTSDLYGGQYYNAAPTLRSKVDLSMRAGKKTAGIGIWELGQDRAGQTYSLLDAIYQRMKNTYGLDGLPSNPCTLPVTFLEFSLEELDEAVHLNWTVNETDNDFFVVERSRDGILFEEIFRVDSKSDNRINHYIFSDQHPLTGISYYRIKQVDLDGSVSYSLIKSNSGKIQIANFYPNPTDGLLTIKLNASLLQGSIHIYDAKGQMYYQAESDVQSGEEIHVDLSQLSPGIYYVNVNVDDRSIVEKLVIL